MTGCAVCQEANCWPEVGYVGGRCYGRMAYHLREIPRLCAELATLGYVERDVRHGWRVSGRSLGGDGVRRPVYEPGPADPVAYVLSAGPLSGSTTAPHVSGSAAPPVPIRVDVVDLLAPPRPASRALYARGLLGLDDDQVGTLSAATILETCVRDWAAHLGHHLPDPSVHALCSWLLVRLPVACTEHHAIDEFAGELRELHGALSAACGRLPVRPVPRRYGCPRCKNLSLVLDLSSGYTECTTLDCRAMLTEDEYRAHLRNLLEQARHTPGEAA